MNTSEPQAPIPFVTPAFATPAPIAVYLDIPMGSIRLIAADRADTTVEVLPADVSKGRDLKAAQRIQVGFQEGVLRVASDPARHKELGDPGAVEVTVQLPAGSSVEARAAAAEFHGAGPLGDVVFQGATGSVKLEEAASARLVLQDGGIAVGRLAGPADIRTQHGDITVAEATRGEVVLRTAAGSLSVGAAHGVSATLDAGTGHGRIANALQNSVGTAAELTIRATTSRGDITARSL